MKKIYILNTSVLNGTVTMSTTSTAYATKELAEKAKIAVEEANKDNSSLLPFTLWQTIQDSELYENENEIPILNKDYENI